MNIMVIGRAFNFIVLFVFILVLKVSAQSKPGSVNVWLDKKSPEVENFNVLHDWIRWSNPGSMRSKFLNSLATPFYTSRKKEISKIVTRQDWQARQAKMKLKLAQVMGPFPEKTPLNPKVTGVIQKSGYRIEKIIFESWENFYVTGCLFIPEKINGKIPAVLNVIGHEQNSYHEPLDQVIIQNLVKKGMIVFVIDPLGQGEHVQYFDPKINFSSIGYSVVEHSYFGNICFLNGTSPANYFIWDGIRAIDYLMTRAEVDPERIGVTGFSGGGTVTTYLAAFDPRIKVSVPCNWSIYNERLMEMKGTQDAETILVHGLKQGISFEDLIEIRAPKPTLMTFTSRDEYLNMQGAKDAFYEAKKTYIAFGKSDHLQWVEDDSKHWMTPKIRLTIYAFFMKHFGLVGDSSEVEAEIIDSKDLWVTPTGQISNSFGGDMVFDVNKKKSLKLLENLERSRSEINKHLNQVVVKAKNISGYLEPCCKEIQPVINGRYQRNGYTISKLAMKGEGEYAIPILLFLPNDQIGKKPAVIYLHPQNKSIDAEPGGKIEQLISQGYIVAAIDVLGVGETANLASRNMSDGNAAILVGRSLVGIQAGDIIRVVHYLMQQPQIDSSKLIAIAKGDLCLPLLHAAAFDTSIKSLILIHGLTSYKSIVMNRIYKIGLTPRPNGGTHHPYEIDFSWGIAGVLKAYDLPDLLGSIAPRKVVLINPHNHLLENASPELIDEDYKFPRAAYSLKKAPQNFKIVKTEENLNLIMTWIFE